MKVPVMRERDRRTLLVGIITIGTLLTVFRGVPTWRLWVHNKRESARNAVSEATESKFAVRNASLLNKRLEIERQQYQMLGAALLEGDQATASAALTSAIGDAASSNNLQVGALQPLGDSGATSGVMKISVRGSATGDVSGVAHFLATIESGAPLMSIAELSITQADPAAAADHPESLHLDFVIAGIADCTDHDTCSVLQASHPTAITSIPVFREVEMYSQSALHRVADSLVITDPFRLERKPANVAFGAPVVTALSPPKPRIQLVLNGIIGGPPWRAVLTGVPGHDGNTIVAAGDTVGGLRIRSIKHDGVVVQGPDTTWDFAMKR